MGILQARILEWVAMPSSRGSSQPRDRIQVSHIAGEFFTIWATREAPEITRICYWWDSWFFICLFVFDPLFKTDWHWVVALSTHSPIFCDCTTLAHHSALPPVGPTTDVHHASEASVFTIALWSKMYLRNKTHIWQSRCFRKDNEALLAWQTVSSFCLLEKVHLSWYSPDGWWWDGDKYFI